MNRSAFRTIILFVIMITMLIFTEHTDQGVRYGLLLWYQSIVPALFPFIVISTMIISESGISLIMKPLHKIIRPFLPLSENGCFALLAGLICGYPMGAKTCAEFLHTGRMDVHEFKFLMAICNFPSPMFLLGFVYPFFREQITLTQFVCSLYIPLIPLAMAAKMHYFGLKNKHSYQYFETPDTDLHTFSIDQAILGAAETLCKIGGYLVFFSVLIQMIKQAFIIPAALRLFIIGIIEMTTAVRELHHALPFPLSYIGSVTAISFGGISALFQVKTVIQENKYSDPGSKNEHEKKAGLSIRPYFLWKLAHTGIAALCAWGICNYAS